jgi:hypothetical protein
VLFAILIAVPFIDRSPERYWRRRPVAMGIAGGILIALIVLTLLVTMTSPAQHLGFAIIRRLTRAGPAGHCGDEENGFGYSRRSLVRLIRWLDRVVTNERSDHMP